MRLDIGYSLSCLVLNVFQVLGVGLHFEGSFSLQNKPIDRWWKRQKWRDRAPYGAHSDFCVADCASKEWKTVSNILTLRGFASSYCCDSHISFLLLLRALSNFFCCGVNMEFLWKFNYRGLWRFCKQRHIGCVYLPLPNPGKKKKEKPVEFLIYSSKKRCYFC